MIECPACKTRTETVRSMTAEGIITDYICRDCNIAWYIDEDGKTRIRLSSTHTLAAKLDEKKFKKLIEVIKKHTHD